MYLARLAFLLCLCVSGVSGLSAGEAEVKNAAEFLATLKEVNKSICKTSQYRILLGGALIGSGQVKIEASEIDKKPCYRVELHIAVRLGGKSISNLEVCHVAPNLRVLLVTGQTREEGVQAGGVTLTFDGKSYLQAKTNKDGSCRTWSFEATDGLLIGSSEELAAMLLPKDTKKSYEFGDWDEDEGAQSQFFDVKGESSYGRFKGTAIARRYLSKKKNRQGVEETKTYTDEMIISETGQISHQRLDRRSIVLELDDGETSVETVRKYERPVDPVIAWCRAVVTKDETLLGEAINIDTYVDELVKRNATLQNKTEAELRLIKVLAKATVTKGWLEKSDTSERLKGIFEGMSSDDYDMKFEHSDRVKLVLNDHFRKRTGDKSVLFFIVERDADSGKWKFVWLATEDDEF